MKNTNFERVEHAHGDLRTEQVIVHKKRRYSHWKLKLLSVVLALLIWLIMVNVTESKTPNNAANQSCLSETIVEQM